ncbi:hypothetical protein AURDEDRAFT_169498 [Auricularia subglabra TFB-10046 SS5]|uniref:Uncharacterized protein n=1 Tax=Auricularia subglabra (strain TFB-10046 / SS5) TaxID=717982 RepID=J0D2P5_AURST|nr:hypothetical protein AURDEDRAFT_169498 [Auricularia subglabra TFB-10046 SS5]
MAVEQAASFDIFVEDNDPRGAWDESTDRNIIAFGATYHLTSVGGAWAALTFTGSKIWYFADRPDSHTSFGVSLDGGPMEMFSSYNAALMTGQLLFYASLSPGVHMINVTNIDDGRYTGMDRFVYVVADLGPPFPDVTATHPRVLLQIATHSPTRTVRQRHSGLTAGSQAGIILLAAALAIFAVLTGASWFSTGEYGHVTPT